MIYLSAVLGTFFLTVILVPPIRQWALRLNVVDDPAIDPHRRVHSRPVALLGGVAIWFSISIVVLWFTFVQPDLLAQYIKLKFILGLLLGGSILMVGGYFDDRYKLPTFWKIFFPLLATIAVVVSGMGVNFITSPFGGVWRIDQWKIELFYFQGIPYYLNVGSDLFTVVWLMVLMYTTKLLDGLDGLVTGITSLGAGVIFFLSLSAMVLQFDTALLAAIIAGAFLGFLPYNWSPANIFIGDGGSLLSGYLLGVLAIIAGGKMATTILILGVPFLDLAWVVVRRIFLERKSPIQPDRKHLHFRLLDLGLSVRQAVFFLYLVSGGFGVSALFLQSKEKFYALIFLGIFVFIVGLVAVLMEQRNNHRSHENL